MLLCYKARQIVERFQRVNLPQRGLDRLCPGRLDRGFVHAGIEQVADLLLIGRTRGIGLPGLQQQPPEVELVLISELSVDVPPGLVRGYRVVFEPCPAGVLIEVVARLHGAVHCFEVQARRVRKGVERFLRQQRREREQKENRERPHDPL